MGNTRRPERVGTRTQEVVVVFTDSRRGIISASLGGYVFMIEVKNDDRASQTYSAMLQNQQYIESYTNKQGNIDAQVGGR